MAVWVWAFWPISPKYAKYAFSMFNLLRLFWSIAFVALITTNTIIITTIITSFDAHKLPIRWSVWAFDQMVDCKFFKHFKLCPEFGEFRYPGNKTGIPHKHCRKNYKIWAKHFHPPPCPNNSHQLKEFVNDHTIAREIFIDHFPSFKCIFSQKYSLRRNIEIPGNDINSPILYFVQPPHRWLDRARKKVKAHAKPMWNVDEAEKTGASSECDYSWKQNLCHFFYFIPDPSFAGESKR